MVHVVQKEKFCNHFQKFLFWILLEYHIAKLVAIFKKGELNLEMKGRVITPPFIWFDCIIA